MIRKLFSVHTPSLQQYNSPVNKYIFNKFSYSSSKVKYNSLSTFGIFDEFDSVAVQDNSITMFTLSNKAMKMFKSKTLLSVSADAKTIKGEKFNVLTGILYLAPHNISGFQVCPKASEGCKIACLYSAGRGVYNNVQNARIRKTREFFTHRAEFMATLVNDIERIVRKANRLGMIPAIRLNGTSDIAWEKIKCVRNGVEYGSVFEAFPKVRFYDYTAIVNRHKALSLPNYHLTFSLKENNDADAIKALEQGYNVAVVMRVKRKAIKPETWSGFPVIDGDESDLRFMDARGGHIVGLTAKGKARYDKSGFVREVYESFNI